MIGKVKHINRAKFFGFIEGNDGKSYFFHVSGLRNIAMDQLKEKASVSFSPTTSDKGLRAEEIYVGE